MEPLICEGFQEDSRTLIASFSDSLNEAVLIMAAPRRVIELAFSDENLVELTRVARSRTEPASRVERARTLLAYRETPSFYAVGRAIGVTHQTVERCLRRAERLGVMAALDDSPRPGREPVITDDARTFVIDLACRKAKDLGYPHELWTTRLLAKHIREHAPAAGHACLAKLAQGTLCKILGRQDIKPHKVRYYLERRDPDFDAKMAEVLCVYREVELLKQSAAARESEAPAVAIISYDEKPGLQAIGTTAPDLPPVPSRHQCLARDHEYVRRGTLSLLAGIDLVTGEVHASRKDIVRASSSPSCKSSTPPIRRRRRSRSSSIITRPTSPRKPRLGSSPSPKGASPSSSPRSTALGSISSRASSPSWRAPCCATSALPPNRNSRIESWPPSMTSIAIPSSTPGATNSMKRRDMSRS